MSLHEDQAGSTTVLTPQGDMDITTLPAFEARVSQLIKSGTKDLIWDLSQVSFLPSTAAGFLLQTARRVRGIGGQCVLAGGSSRVLGTLRTMGVLQLFPVYADRKAALEALSA